ncbi:hypothetical protein EWB00_008206 [Schistosoma japonicum]|uniref:Uncharacterized protein n=1 Tax=Schistosoma japonicum TaxID=6182 RepID=A0A4Z2CRK0_SCHJA|nr:hypothetical protein EWB00_008206 [Schistosoma japonicum]
MSRQGSGKFCRSVIGWSIPAQSRVLMVTLRFLDASPTPSFVSYVYLKTSLCTHLS